MPTEYNSVNRHNTSRMARFLYSRFARCNAISEDFTCIFMKQALLFSIPPKSKTAGRGERGFQESLGLGALWEFPYS